MFLQMEIKMLIITEHKTACWLSQINYMYIYIFYISDFTSTIFGQSFEKSWRQYWRLCKEAALPLLYLLLVSLFMTTDFVESQSFIL